MDLDFAKVIENARSELQAEMAGIPVMNETIKGIHIENFRVLMVGFKICLYEESVNRKNERELLVLLQSLIILHIVFCIFFFFWG